MAAHYSIVEGDGKHGCMPFFINCGGYLATKPLVEDGIPRSLYFGITMHKVLTFVHERIKILLGYLGPRKI